MRTDFEATLILSICLLIGSASWGILLTAPMRLAGII